MAQLDKFGHHEVIDRLGLIQSVLNDFVIEHEVVEANPILRELVESISSDIHEAYQLAAVIMFEKFPEAEA